VNFSSDYLSAEVKRSRCSNNFAMDIDDEDDVDSQRPPFDPAALERELNEK
jgi:hypothetical protein